MRAFYHTDSKGPDNKNTPSTHQPWRQNVTTSVWIKQKVTYAKISPQKWWTPEILLGTEKSKKWHNTHRSFCLLTPLWPWIKVNVTYTTIEMWSSIASIITYQIWTKSVHKSRNTCQHSSFFYEVSRTAVFRKSLSKAVWGCSTSSTWTQYQISS